MGKNRNYDPEKRKARYLAHRAEILAREREKYASDPEKIKARMKVWYENNREKKIQSVMAYRKKKKLSQEETLPVET